MPHSSGKGQNGSASLSALNAASSRSLYPDVLMTSIEINLPFFLIVNFMSKSPYIPFAAASGG